MRGQIIQRRPEQLQRRALADLHVALDIPEPCAGADERRFASLVTAWRSQSSMISATGNTATPWSRQALRRVHCSSSSPVAVHRVLAGVALASDVPVDGADGDALMCDVALLAPSGQDGDEAAVEVRGVGNEAIEPAERSRAARRPDA